MENSTESSSGLISSEERDFGDMLLKDAAAAIDAGEYRAALSGLTQALEFMYKNFGANPKLNDLEETIAEIKSLLEK